MNDVALIEAVRDIEARHAATLATPGSTATTSRQRILDAIAHARATELRPDAELRVRMDDALTEWFFNALAKHYGIETFYASARSKALSISAPEIFTRQFFMPMFIEMSRTVQLHTFEITKSIFQRAFDSTIGSAA
jgi:hypothetical protein